MSFLCVVWTSLAFLWCHQNSIHAFKVRYPKSLLSTPLGGKDRGRRLYFGNINDVNFLAEGISNIDQFIQGALNQATSTPALTALTDPITTNVPGLNLINLDETAEGALNPLGNDLLIFFCTTIGIVPLFKWLKASSVIGFLSAGLLMGPAGLKVFSDLKDMESIADFGVLFLLFEQGLELTVDRLRSLSKYAFGMGTLQVILCTAAFFVFPFIGGVQFLEIFMGSDSALVDIERVDEAMVIGAALSLSSSAFVLKILQEKGQMSTKFGAACLGILLLQDIAVVPLLVLLPIIESNSGPMPLSAQLALLGATFVKAILGLGGILVIGGGIVRYLFSLVAKTGSSETFIALCLLVALGTGKVHSPLRCLLRFRPCILVSHMLATLSLDVRQVRLRIILDCLVRWVLSRQERSWRNRTTALKSSLTSSLSEACCSGSFS